ncbi:MAG: transposase, partial [Candidatus Woesearchaeota archaeon]
QLYHIRCRKLSFDSDHVHMILDLGLFSKPELAKKIRGYVGKKLFELLPWIKKQKFWGSGLWNPAYDIRSINDMDFYCRYLDKQKYACAGQRMITAY